MKLQKKKAFTVFLSYQPTPHVPSLLIPSSFQLVFALFRWKPHIKIFGSSFLQWLRAQSAYMNIDTNLCSCESFEKVMANLVEKTFKKKFFFENLLFSLRHSDVCGVMPLFPSAWCFWNIKWHPHIWVWWRKEIFAWNWVSVSSFLMPRVFFRCHLCKAYSVSHHPPECLALETVCILKCSPKVNWWRPEGAGRLSPRTLFSCSVNSLAMYLSWGMMTLPAVRFFIPTRGAPNPSRWWGRQMP